MRYKTSQVARWSLFILLGTAALVLCLDILEHLRFVSDATEGCLRFIASIISFIAIAYFGKHSDLPRSLAFCAGAFLLIGSFLSLIAWTEDIRSIAHWPVLGRDSALGNVLKANLTIAWFIIPSAMTYILLQRHEDTQDTLEKRISERTIELSETNNRLQLEVREHLNTEQELEKTQQDLEQVIAERSKELEKVQQHLIRQERMRALGQMSSGIAHELNNTLTPLVSYSELLKLSTGLTERQRKWVDNICHAADDAAHMVQNLQLFQSNKTSRNLTDFDVNKTVSQTVEFSKPIWKNTAESTGKKITVNTSQQTGTAMARGNPSELRQVLMNLLLNGIDAIESSGQIDISTDLVDERVVITVADNGRGMSAEELKSCCEPFVTSKTTGTGLGLSVCHGIVKRHGGKFEVSSETGHGTTIRFDLPVSPLSAEFVQLDTETIPQDCSNLRVLYVDDDEAVRASVAALIRSSGAMVATANGAMDALQQFSPGRFDAVVTDLGMPGMDGADLVRSIINIDPRVRVAIASGWPRSKIDARFSTGNPPNAVLSKPIRLSEVHRFLTETHQSKLTELREVAADNSTA